MPWPAWKAPLNRSEPGVSRPMKRSVDGVGQRRRHARGDERRVHPAPVGAGARRRADADRRVQLRGVRGVELVGQEVRGLQGRVPLRRQVVEADAVVERQPAAGLPVVLRVPLDVLVAPLGQRVLVGLRVDVEHAGGRVRVAEARIERVVGVVGEVDLAVEAREDALRLEAVLVVEAGLRRRASPRPSSGSRCTSWVMFSLVNGPRSVWYCPALSVRPPRKRKSGT